MSNDYNRTYTLDCLLILMCDAILPPSTLLIILLKSVNMTKTKMYKKGLGKEHLKNDPLICKHF